MDSLPAEGALLFLGDGVNKYAGAIEARFGDRAILASELASLRASAACAIAARRRETWVEASALVPIYFRAPQAERERKEREGCAG